MDDQTLPSMAGASPDNDIFKRSSTLTSVIGKLRGPEKRSFEANLRGRTSQPRKQGSIRLYKEWLFYGCILLNLYTISRFYIGYSPAWLSYYRNSEAVAESCPIPLPTLFSQHPPPANHPALKLARKSFEKTLNRFYREKKLDSLAVAIVTPSGSIYEGFRGTLRANETSHKTKVDRHSIYRIASISKLLASLETLILRDRGALNLDDPISKFIPELDYQTQKHSNSDKSEEKITFRQLMSHMAGLGREHPDGDASGHWPETLGPNAPPGTNGNPFPNTTDLLRAIADRHLIMTPYRFPSYSNTGFALLGAANLAAARSMEGSTAPQSYDDLVKRDIFDTLGMQDSSFRTDDSNRDRVVVPSVASGEVDHYMRADNSAGGQMSSLSDFVLLAQNLLNPSSKAALLPPLTVLEWLNPIFNFWDGITSVGIPWEITHTRHAFGRTIKEYKKAGSLSSLFSSFTIVPSHSFAVVVLTSSKENHSAELHRLIMEYFLPAFDEALFQATERQLAGTWISESDKVELHIIASAGSLFATRYLINGTDALATLNDGHKVDRVPIWPMGNDEFRLRPTLMAAGNPGCLLGWVTLDGFTYMNGYAVNLVRLLPHWTVLEKTRLEIPAMKVILKRK